MLYVYIYNYILQHLHFHDEHVHEHQWTVSTESGYPLGRLFSKNQPFNGTVPSEFDIASGKLTVWEPDNYHRNSGFSHDKLWCSIVFWCFLYVYQRVPIAIFLAPVQLNKTICGNSGVSTGSKCPKWRSKSPKWNIYQTLQFWTKKT